MVQNRIAFVSAIALLGLCRTPVSDAKIPAARFAKAFAGDTERLSFTAVRGVLNTISADGSPAAEAAASSLEALRGLPGVVLMVHGTQYDPSRIGLPNPHSTFSHVVRSHLSSELTGVSFAWFSAPLSFKNQFLSFRRGAPTVYGLAKKSLKEQIAPLSRLIEAFPPQWSAVCHSLGCELIRITLESNPHLPKPRRMLLLSGDLREDALDRLSFAEGLEVFAVRSESDFPLSRSGFRKESKPFWKGEQARRSKWVDFVFSPAELEKGRRFSFDYNNRRRYWDHMATFEFGETWKVYNDFLVHGLPLRTSIPQLRRIQLADAKNNRL